MTWANRFRLLAGILVLALVLSALTLVFNQRQSRVASASASVDAPYAVVGSGYGGVVTAQLVSPGQQVHRGDEMFRVVSPQVQHDASLGFQPAPNDAFTVDAATGSITYRAVIDGQVSKIDATLGSYLQAGAALATVTAETPKSVIAEFDLEPSAHARVDPGAAVTVNLADYRQIKGTVSDLSVTTRDGRTLTTVRVVAPALEDPQYAHLTRAGSPVQAVMELRDEGPLSGTRDAMMEFLIKIGMR